MKRNIVTSRKLETFKDVAFYVEWANLMKRNIVTSSKLERLKTLRFTLHKAFVRFNVLDIWNQAFNTFANSRIFAHLPWVNPGYKISLLSKNSQLLLSIFGLV